MHKKTSLILLLTLVIFLELNAQEINEPDTYWNLYEQRELQNERNKKILLGWGVANMVSGIALYGTDYRDIGVMNASWGLINASIAILAMRNAESFNRDDHSLSDLLQAEQKFNRIVALNTGLDVAYVTAGLAMTKYGNGSMIRQYGTSVMIQGTFLFLYDLFLLRESSKYLNQISLYPDILISEHYIDASQLRSSGIQEQVVGLTLRVQIF